MAEVFEIEILVKEKMSLGLLLQQINDKFLLKTIETIDNWEWVNNETIELSQIDNLSELIESKIIFIKGTYYDNDCGLICHKESSNYCYDLWISTDKIRDLAKDSITKSNSNIYDAVLQNVIGYVKNYELIFCAMGVEIFISDDSDIDKILENSINVIRWILPKEISLDLVGYTKQIVSNYNVYSLNK